MIGVDPVGLSPLGFAFGKKKPEVPQGNSGRFHKVNVRRVVVTKGSVEKDVLEKVSIVQL